jgi:3-phenylpropionate/trans-cinnamate dioxygenase ferredoxin subunit
MPTHGIGYPHAALPLASRIDICPVSELPPGASVRVETEDFDIGVFNCDGQLLAMEDRCSHDDSVLLDEGGFDAATCTIECPRHGSVFDLRTGRPTTLPAYEAVETFPVLVEDGVIKLELE